MGEFVKTGLASETLRWRPRHRRVRRHYLTYCLVPRPRREVKRHWYMSRHGFWDADSDQLQGDVPNAQCYGNASCRSIPLDKVVNGSTEKPARSSDASEPHARMHRYASSHHLTSVLGGVKPRRRSTNAVEDYRRLHHPDRQNLLLLQVDHVVPPVQHPAEDWFDTGLQPTHPAIIAVATNAADSLLVSRLVPNP